MMFIVLLLSGLTLGILVTVIMARYMLKSPRTRIWLSDWVNWSNNQLPDNCHQLVRHGKWIASPNDKEDS